MGVRVLKRLLLSLGFLWTTSLYAQTGPGPVPYRGLNNWPLIFGTDNTYDIGASGATRPRTGYFGTSVITPSLTVSGLTSGRVPFASTGGLLADDADLTFDGTVLSGARYSAPDGSPSATGFRLQSGGATYGWYWISGVGWVYSDGGTALLSLHSAQGPTIAATKSLLWGSSGISAQDVSLAREGAGVLTVRNGTTSRRAFLGGGSSVASASALPVPVAALYHLTGTTTVTSITSTNLGTGPCIVLIFDGVLTMTDGSNLKLAGDFVTSADDTMLLCFDGTSFFEVSRSVN